VSCVDFARSYAYAFVNGTQTYGGRGRDISMMDSNAWIKASTSASPKERSTCGFRQRLIKKDDGAPASVTRLKTSEAKPHWHRETHEYYCVLDGSGKLVIGEQEVPVCAGDCVWIKPGYMHHAEGDLESLIIAVPAFDPEDMFFDPPSASD
jgi:mannose-6-phosphate isomerase-like protein (cupin superfamily)